MTAREHRVIGAGLGIVFGALVLLRLVPAVLRLERDIRSRVGERAARVQHIQHGLASLGQLEDSAGALQVALVQLAPRLIAGRSRAESQAEGVALLRSLGESQGVRVERVMPLPDTQVVGSLLRISLRYEAESDANGIARLLRGIGSQQIVFEIAALRLVAAEPASSGTAPERIRLEMVVRGWLLAGRDGQPNGPKS